MMKDNKDFLNLHKVFVFNKYIQMYIRSLQLSHFPPEWVGPHSAEICFLLNTHIWGHPCALALDNGILPKSIYHFIMYSNRHRTDHLYTETGTSQH